jgi:hypothetical protein
MNRLIACMIGGTVHQTFGGNATTADIIPTDLSQIYDAASWVGTVELATPDLRAADQDFVKASTPGAVAGLMAEGDR